MTKDVKLEGLATLMYEYTNSSEGPHYIVSISFTVVDTEYIMANS